VVTLVGSALSGATAVTFNGLGAAFTVVSPTQVTATVPAGATTGPIAITTRGGRATSASSFTVIPTPAIARLNRRTATRGATVIVGGSGFGDARGTSSVRFGSKPCTTYVSWSATRIACKVPSTASLGTVKVTVVTAGGTSNAIGFKVKK
jgi:hypothetical protein